MVSESEGLRLCRPLFGHMRVRAFLSIYNRYIRAGRCGVHSGRYNLITAKHARAHALRTEKRGEIAQT